MTHQAIHEEWALRASKAAGHDPAALRCALANAAHMCDAVAKDILDEHTGPGKKRPRRRGVDIAAAMTRASDAIWQLREKVKCNEYSEEKKQLALFQNIWNIAKMITSDELRKILRAACKMAGSQAEWVRRNSKPDAIIQRSHVSEVLNGDKEPSAKIGKALGYKKVNGWIKKPR